MYNLKYLNNYEIIEISQSIYDFLMDETDHKKYSSFSDIPSLKRMESTVSKYDTDMIQFTQFLYKNFYPEYYTEFKSIVNSDTRKWFQTYSRPFYRMVLRQFKLELLCQNM
jgi:hypothetical protein